MFFMKYSTLYVVNLKVIDVFKGARYQYVREKGREREKE